MIKRFSKSRRIRNKGLSYSGNLISFGNFALKSLSWGRLTSRQIEAGRKVISRHIKKLGKLWIRVYPDISYTKKPIDVRMGNGKGEISFYYFNVKPGRIIYEISGLDKNLSLKVLKLASFKLPLVTTIACLKY